MFSLEGFDYLPMSYIVEVEGKQKKYWLNELRKVGEMGNQTI